MKTESTVYIVNYTDPDRTAEGTGKTRHFQTIEKAREFIRQLDQFAPNSRDVQITRQHIIVNRERVY